MVKTWAEETAGCRQVVEPILEGLRDEVAPNLEWHFDPDLGFDFDAVCIKLKRDQSHGTAFVTFEAWVNARSNPSELHGALEDVVRELATPRSKSWLYVITTTGLVRKPRRTPTERVLDEAAALEADALAQQFPTRLRH